MALSVFACSYVSMNIRIIAALALACIFAIPVAASAATEKAPSCSLSADKATVRTGEQITLRWKSRDAVIAYGIAGLTLPTEGKQVVGIPFTGSHVLSIFFIGPGGVTVCSEKVRMLPRK